MTPDPQTSLSASISRKSRIGNDMNAPLSSASGHDLTTRERLADEIARQYEVVSASPWQRNALLFCGYVFCSLFTYPALMLTLAAIDITAEMLSIRLQRRLDPVTSPGRYALTLVLVVVMAVCVSTAAGMTWLVDNPYAKALASGLGIITLLQLSSVRSIHLPYGVLGMATVSLIMLGINAAHWLATEDYLGLAISSLAALTAITYAVLAMLANHDLHNTNARTLAQARASDAAKSLFLAQMSHELRTPLNAIIGLGEVEAAAARGFSRERLQTLVTSARGLAEVLDDVLDLSAINTGQLSIVPRPTDLRGAIAATVAIAAPSASAQEGNLVFSIAPSVPEYAMLDAQRLRQCLTNLISNALKHAAGKGVRVLVDHHDGRLTVDVVDSGPGVPPEVAQTLFEPFRRGNTVRPGLGLGLAISRSLARQMGGDLILVPSTSGAAFRLVVDSPTCSPPPRSEVLNLSGKRILVVDDVATNRMVAAGLLRTLGAEVVGAASGAEALKLLDESTVDLVLLDMAMPGLNGFETFRRLREGKGKAIPVIAMTAGAMPDQRREIEKAGMDGFLAKPILPEAIGPALGPHLGPKAG